MDVPLLVSTLKAQALIIATAESCTGGLISAAITSVPGSSAVFDRGFITYSNQSKMELLGVKRTTLESFGAVSEEIAKEMAMGALMNSKADIAVSVTGIAGPDGGSDSKPVGLVYIGLATKDGRAQTERLLLHGDRHSIRQQATERALAYLSQIVG